jgi:hypothetical protein
MDSRTGRPPHASHTTPPKSSAPLTQLRPPACRWAASGCSRERLCLQNDDGVRERCTLRAAIVYRSGVARADLVRDVLSSLPSGADSVPFPDHPLLLRGPDVLASINGRLVAYFVLSRSMRQIIPDVVLSRLALPAGTRFILALSEPLSFREDNTAFFEEIFVISDRANARTPTGITARPDGIQAIESIRPFHHERFADAWARTTRRWHRKRKTPGEPSSLYSTMAGRGSRYIDFHNGEFILLRRRRLAGEI